MSAARASSGRAAHTHSRVSATANPGFLDRLGHTAVGAAVGIALFFLSIYLLFTNEGHVLETASSLDEGLSLVVPLDSSSSLDLHNNNRLVHVSAQLRTSQPLHDPNYRVEVQAVKLKREVEMYQWVENTESRDYKENGETKTETTYTYTTEWRSALISSRHFDEEIGHQNPSAMAVESVTVVAPEVRVGAFVLSEGLVQKINNFQTLSLRDFTATNLDPFLSIYDDYFYHTQTPRRPEVGDVRVRFSFAGLSSEASTLGPAQTVSIVAKQAGDQLTAYRTKAGGTLDLLYLEELSAEEVFSKAQRSNSQMAWGMRALGWLLMFVSLSLTSRIIYTLVDWVPLLRELVAVGLTIFAACVSTSLSLLTVAAGWLFYRPLTALVLAALALVPLLLARYRLPAKKNE